MEDIKLELQNLWNEIMNEEEEDIRETENAYLDSLDDSAFDDIDSLINWFLFF